MSQLDDLLARSSAPGAFAQRRTFSLSREKAIDKQREFALRHPRQYVLELVQAAVFAGATYIAIDSKPNTLLIAWVGGPTLSTGALETLFDHLFADRSDRSVRQVVQLAIGVNAMLKRKPHEIRIESGDGTSAVRLDLDGSGQGTVGTTTASIAGSYVYADFGGAWLARARGDRWTPEQGLIEERCMYTPVPILLNGRAPFGYRSGRSIEVFGAQRQMQFDTDGRRGVVAVHASARAPTGIRIVVGGVWISTLPLEPLADQPLVGVVCDDNLRKTADQAGIVQDVRYVAMLHAVQPHATALIRALRDTDRPYLPPPLPRLADGTAEPSEPLPEPIPTVPPRGPIALAQIAATAGAPLFYVDPADAAELTDRGTEPDRFPWQILVLSPGQALTLAAEVPGAPLHRLTGRADVDFARRIISRGVQIRSVALPASDHRLVLRRHRAGPLPAWGHGIDGTPFCVIDPRGTYELGVVHSGTIVPTGSRAAALADRDGAPEAWPLPRVSLLLEHTRGSASMTAAHLDRALANVWRLVPDDGSDPAFLIAILSAVTVPQLVRVPDGSIRAAASLPVGWPDRLLDDPLLPTEDGPLSLRGFLALLGTGRTVAVVDYDALLTFETIERRFGFGHLTHPRLDDAQNHSEARARGLRQIATLRQAAERGAAGHPLLQLPADAPVVARHGVQLPDRVPRVTRDELQVLLDVGRRPALWLDDAPAVWRSLCDGDAGWLVRTQLTEGRLRGWLGLRSPLDPTAAVVLRTNEQLIGLPELDQSAPAHGLLWLDGGGTTPDPGWRRLVRLAGLRLYQQLVAVLRHETDSARIAHAQQAARRFVLLTWGRAGQLSGTAAQLAQLVPVERDGVHSGNLAAWLALPAERRPDVGLTLPDPRQSDHAGGIGVDRIEARLAEAVRAWPSTALPVTIRAGRASGPAAQLQHSVSHGGAVLQLNGNNPLTSAAIQADGPHREILLLECARLLCAYAARRRRHADLCRVQQVLVAQRFG